MAKFYPEHFPQWAANDPSRSAERKIFASLASLSDDFTVFYSVSWQVHNKRGAKDGEADFVIAHPDLGVLIVEVKGGRIRYEANLQQWFSIDRYDVEHLIKDPVQQARNSKGALLTKLKELPSWDNRFLTIAYLVAFPDVVVDARYLRPDLPRTLIADATDLSNMVEKVESVFKWFHGQDKRQGSLGVYRLRTLERLLAQSFTLRTPMGVELEHDEQRIITLTENQLHLLHFIQAQRRALIEGCAGSGKTMLALEKVRQLAEQGLETLLLCFNVPLAEYLRQRAPDNVDVIHFHGLCKELAKEAGVGFRAFRGDQREYYDTVLPEMLMDAIDELGPQYDAIIVDEGQDFLDKWWEILFFLLRDQERGIFYVFYDSNQNIYRRKETLKNLIGGEPFILNENCRNTHAIHEVVKAFYHDPASLLCHGPEGRPPEIFYFSTPHEQESLVRKVLHRLTHDEKVAPHHIVLLTTRSPEKTLFHPGRKIGNHILMEKDDTRWRSTNIRVSSVHRFKGLESRVVILTGLEDNDPKWLMPLLYVACSRARTHLIVVAHQRSRAQIDAIFPSNRGTHEIF